jgi:hypothetical protein
VLVDAQTFRELEVFNAAGGAPSLFDILNRTRTAGGRDALLRRFRQPLSSAGEIIDVQNALQFILNNRTTFELLPNDGQLKTVQNYLRANFTSVQGSGQMLTLESYWIQFRYSDIYREARAGVRATFGFTQQLARFLEVLDISALPRVIDDLIYTIRSELLESETLSTHAEHTRRAAHACARLPTRPAAPRTLTGSPAGAHRCSARNRCARVHGRHHVREILRFPGHRTRHRVD